MSEPSARAIEWLGQQIGELSGIRNATARDPSFKNWRQNTLTVMQRIWPADQGRCERFRRIPFSPADARAEVRVQREWYSRGCQEAARVLASFVDEIRREGVPDQPPELVESASDAEFEDDFPTVELPAGEADPAAPPYSPPDSTTDVPAPDSRYPATAGLEPPSSPDPRFTAGPAERSSPQHAEPPSPQPAEPLPGSRGRKGLGVAAKLRDLLGFAGLSAKALTGPLLEPFNPAPPPPRPTPSAPDLGIIPVGDDVTPVRRTYPPLQAPDQTPRQPQPGSLPDAGKSVIMSKPTTLRTSIEKVSIESLISPQFRAGAEPGTGTPDAVGPTGVAPAGASPAGPSEESPEAPSGSPSHPFVPPLSGDPEFNVNPAPPAPRRPGPQTGAGPGVRTPGARPLGKVVPLPLPPGARRPEPEEESGPEAPPPPTMSEPSGPSPMSAPSAPPGAEDVARATEDFLRSSPVLGATGRKVQRHYPDPGSEGFHDPDAIAVISMVEELSLMGVPANRHSETRARLVALAARMERGDLEWTLLRKAVWFAMEYPELARRLMPVLLTWIDRAA